MFCSRFLGLTLAAALSFSTLQASAATSAERLFNSKVTACEKVKDAANPKPYSVCVIKANTDILSQTVANENRLGRLYRTCVTKFSAIKGAEPLVRWCRSQPAERAKYKIVAAATPFVTYQRELLAAYETKEYSAASHEKIVAAQLEDLRSNIPTYLSVQAQLNTSESSIRGTYRQATGKSFAY